MQKPLTRTAEPALFRALETFRVVSIVGPRQSGKTTLTQLTSVRKSTRRTFVSLDDIATYEAAKSDPSGFVSALSTPTTIDEFQRAPELLLAIKRAADTTTDRGSYLLTGSADPAATRSVRESLAGRMLMLKLRPLTWFERNRKPHFNGVRQVLGCRSARQVQRLFGTGSHSPTGLAKEVRMGGFPEPSLRLNVGQRASWHEQYIRTYLERDVPRLVQPDDVTTFLRFVRLTAAATGQLLRLSRLAGDCGVSVDTARRWLSVLESTYVVDVVAPYFRNVRKRLVKSPKLHFVDTGLAMALLGVSDWRQASKLNLAGALTESWVHHQLAVCTEALNKPASLHFFRTSAGTECDFVVEVGNRLLPIEVKASSNPSSSDISGLREFLALFPEQAPFGLLLHAGSDTIPIANKVVGVPMSAFFSGVAADSSNTRRR